MAWFLIRILSIWGALHLYVFWRLASIPWVTQYIAPLGLMIAGVALWSSYVVARVLDAKGLQVVSWPIEYIAANWLGLLFLLFWALLAVDVLTLGGWLFHAQAPTIRGWAVAIACFLSIVALIQAIRPPVITDYEVQLAGLPRERDGTVLLQLSDLHLGNLLGRRWLGSLISRVNQMKPDMVVIAGDLVDGNVGRVESLREVLKGLHAPLGVWAVTGNHEFYAGLERSVRLLEDSGFRVLRDRHEQAAPGLILAGVDDLTARRQFGAEDHAIEKAMANRPQGATILLSHSPWQATPVVRKRISELPSRRGRDSFTSITPPTTSPWRTRCFTNPTRPYGGCAVCLTAACPAIHSSLAISSSITSGTIRDSRLSYESKGISGNDSGRCSRA